MTEATTNGREGYVGSGALPRIDTPFQEAIDNKLVGLSADEIVDVIAGLRSAIANTMLTSSLFQQYKMLASILPQRIAASVNEALTSRIEHAEGAERDTLKLALVTLHTKSIASVIEKNNVPEDDQDDALQLILIGLVLGNTTFSPSTASPSTLISTRARGEVNALAQRNAARDDESLEMQGETVAEEGDPVARVIRQETTAILQQILESLPLREGAIISAYVIDNVTLESMRGVFPVSKERMYQLKKIGLSWLGTRIRRHAPDFFPVQREKIVGIAPEQVREAVRILCDLVAKKYQQDPSDDFVDKMSVLEGLPGYTKEIRDKLTRLKHVGNWLERDEYYADTYLQVVTDRVAALLLARIVLLRKKYLDFNFEAELKEALEALDISSASALSHLALERVVEGYLSNRIQPSEQTLWDR